MWSVAAQHRKFNDCLGAYNSLKDPHLNSYFRKPLIRQHLLKANIIDKNNKIVEEISSTKYQQFLERKQKRELYRMLDELVKQNDHIEGNSYDLINSKNVITHAKTVLDWHGNDDSKVKTRVQAINTERDLLMNKLDRMIRAIKEHNTGKSLEFEFGVQRSPSTNDRFKYGEKLRSSKSYQDISSPKFSSIIPYAKSYSSKVSRPKSSYGRQRKNFQLNISNPNLTQTMSDEETVSTNQFAERMTQKSKSYANIVDRSGDDNSDSEIDIDSLEGESLDDSDEQSLPNQSFKWARSKSPPELNKKYYAFDKRFFKNFVGQRVKMTLKYSGLNGATNRGGKRNIKVFQQVTIGGNSILVYDGFVLPGETFSFYVRPHLNNSFAINILVNGIRDLRLNVCCEHKHRRGTKLSHFVIVDVVGGRPCFACQNTDIYDHNEFKRYKLDTPVNSSANQVRPGDESESNQKVSQEADRSNTPDKSEVLETNSTLTNDQTVLKEDIVISEQTSSEAKQACEQCGESLEKNEVVLDEHTDHNADHSEIVSTKKELPTMPDQDNADINTDDEVDEISFDYISDETLPKVGANLDSDTETDSKSCKPHS